MAGTDTPALVWTAPGLALHRELELLVQNGWSPLEAIWAATSTAARALNRSDIRNTLQIERVVKGGRLYEPLEPLAHGITVDEARAMWEKLNADFQQNGR